MLGPNDETAVEVNRFMHCTLYDLVVTTMYSERKGTRKAEGCCASESVTDSSLLIYIYKHWDNHNLMKF